MRVRRVLLGRRIRCAEAGPWSRRCGALWRTQRWRGAGRPPPLRPTTRTLLHDGRGRVAGTAGVDAHAQTPPPPLGDVARRLQLAHSVHCSAHGNGRPRITLYERRARTDGASGVRLGRVPCEKRALEYGARAQWQQRVCVQNAPNGIARERGLQCARLRLCARTCTRANSARGRVVAGGNASTRAQTPGAWTKDR